jgi:predicted enzyme related to lactoylglutathione lyase
MALFVRDLEKQVAFYQAVFGLKHLGYDHQPMGSAVYLTDGTTNLALICPSMPADKYKPGANHCGFQVADLKDTEESIKNAGGSFFFDFGDTKRGNFEKKFKDHDGVVFDISKHGWVGTETYTAKKEAAAAMAPAK